MRREQGNKPTKTVAIYRNRQSATSKTHEELGNDLLISSLKQAVCVVTWYHHPLVKGDVLPRAHPEHPVDRHRHLMVVSTPRSSLKGACACVAWYRSATAEFDKRSETEMARRDSISTIRRRSNKLFVDVNACCLCVLSNVNVFLGVLCAQKEYLKEPTAEFKAMEARQSEFASAQRAYKQEFVKKLDAFLAVETDEQAVSTLNAMSNTVIQRGGLPESVRINDLLKTCRRKKAAMKESGKWSTPVQIAYEASWPGLFYIRSKRSLERN